MLTTTEKYLKPGIGGLFYESFIFKLNDSNLNKQLLVFNSIEFVLHIKPDNMIR